MDLEISKMPTELEFKVHRVRFFLAEVTSINCMSYDETDKKLALIRRRIRKYKTTQTDAQSVVEIWNLEAKAPFVEQTIYDNRDDPTLLESLLWAPNQRLFSCGLNSNLNEYDLTNNCIKKSYSGRSGPIWCMALDDSKSLIVVGTEEGDICVYRIEENGLEFNKILNRNDSRILCIQWFKPEDNSSQLIIAGSINYIKIWNYETGRCVDHIQVSSDGVVVWCLKVLTDFTIISGDSTGKTCFWNGKTTALTASFPSLKADVLCLCVDEDESTVYCSGVDPDIVQYKRSKKKSEIGNPWCLSVPRRLHTHDVRAMTCIGSKWLISGGIDSYLTRSCYPPNLQLRHLTDYSPNVTITKGYVFLKYEAFVQIWKLGESQDDFISQTKENIEIVPLSECAIKFADIKSRKPIIAASFNESWVVYSDSDNIKIKSWSESGIKKVPFLCQPIANATKIVFCQVNTVAIVSGTFLTIVQLDKFGGVVQNCIDLKHRIHLITASSNYIAVCLTDSNNTIQVFTTDSSALNTDSILVCEFVNNCLPTCIQINRNSGGGDLWIAYSNRRIVNYKIKTKKHCKSIQIEECIPSEVQNSVDEFWSIKQICFSTKSVFLSDDNLLLRLDTNTNKINKCDKYQHIIKLGNGIASNELVIVEVTPDMHFGFLPQSLAKKRFGV